MIEPTIGRVVWYRPSFKEIALRHMALRDPNKPFAAHVVFVWSDRLVNLVVFDHDGYDHRVTSVTLVQEGDCVQNGASYAEWMPFQIGQAKKHEGAVLGGVVSSLP